MPIVYRLRGKVWLHPGAAGWHFITLPKGPAQELRGLRGKGAGWGSVPVTATIGATSWKTSIFPDAKSGSFLLPVKAAVRKAEGIEAGQAVAFQLAVAP